MMKRFLTLIGSSLLLVFFCPGFLGAQTEWVSQNSGTEENLQSIDFLDALTGTMAFIAGDAGTIMKTLDGGATWQICNTGVNEALYHIDVVDENFIIACGAKGTILRSSDGGDTWQLTQIPSSIPGIQLDLYSVFINPATGVGYVCGTAQNIHKTNDFGASWTALREGYFGAFFHLQMLSDTEVAVCGENSIFASLIGRTWNGGETWDWRDFYPVDNTGMAWETETRDAHFFTMDTALTVQLEPLNGTGFITPVFDWNEQMWPTMMQTDEFITCLDLRYGRGIIGGGNIKSGGMVYLSPDFGKTWEFSEMPDKIPFVTDVYATASRYYTVGEAGSIYVKDISVGIPATNSPKYCLQVYPNPSGANSRITVVNPFSGESTIEFYSSSGSCMLRSKLNHVADTQITIGNWSPGLYFFRIISEGVICNGRFIVTE